MLRKEASAWLRSAGGSEEEAHHANCDNHGHDHGHEFFISVLSHVRDILKKCVGKKASQKQEKTPTSAQEVTTNSFATLNVEETESTPDQAIDSTNKNITGKNPELCSSYAPPYISLDILGPFKALCEEFWRIRKWIS